MPVNQCHLSWPPALLRVSALGGIALLLSTMVPPAHAATSDTELRLRPHCTLESGVGPFGEVPDVDASYDPAVDACPQFSVEDPQTLRTPILRQGDTLDFDIVVENPSLQGISRVRSWLSYDPNVLEGVSVQIHPNFPSVTPGEAGFDPGNGYVQIEASNETDPEDRPIVVVARILMRVRKTTPSGTFISFYDVQPRGHTTVATQESGNEELILGSEPGSLHVLFSTAGETPVEPEEPEPEVPTETPETPEIPDPVPFVPAPEPGTVPTGGACTVDGDCQSGFCRNGFCAEPEVTTPNEDRTSFSLLQVRNLRVTSEGSDIYLAWDPLNSSVLKAYNVYYGTIPGTYIQRKTVDETFSNLTIGPLTIDTRYYLAIRAVSDDDEESAFSQEVAVTVGDPSSSTAPLVAIPGGGTPPPTNPLNGNVTGNAVPGETGVPTVLAIVVVLSAGMGTLLASRRQRIALTRSPHV